MTGQPRTIVLTPNPALDRTVETRAQRVGRVTRTRLVAQQAGGKGLNVVRVLGQLGVSGTLAVAPLGGMEGTRFEALAHGDGVDLRVIPVEAPTRICLTCRSASGDVIELNEAGEGLSWSEWQLVADRIATMAGAGDTVVISGSFPPGIGAEAIDELVDRLHGAGASVVVDTSGPMLAAAVDAAVDIVVPNVDEARQALEMPGATAVQLGRSLAARGVTALVTDGADGAVLAQTDGRVLVASPPTVAVVSTVGAGDALLAGWLAAHRRGLSHGDALRLATVVGAAACTAPTAGAVDPRLVRRLLEDAPSIRTA